MEKNLRNFFAAINGNDVDAALACCVEDISCIYPEPGRNWKGKERGRVVMTAIFGQLAREGQTVTYELDTVLEHHRLIITTEAWGPSKTRVIKTKYTFSDDNKILSMEAASVTRLG
jgi:ketosteroid isomerase-like protein